VTSPSADNQPSRFVFQDRLGRRWPRLRRVLVIFGAVAACGMVWFIWSLLVRPELRLRASSSQLKGQLRAAIEQSDAASDDTKASEWQKFYQSQSAQERLARVRSALRKGQKQSGEIRLGFYVDWDSNSFASLEEHASSLTHLSPEWFSLVDTDSKLQFSPDPRLSTFAAAHGIALMPLMTNLSEDSWQPEAVENLAHASNPRRTQFINDLIGKLKQTRSSGIILDWEQIDPEYTDEYTTLIVQMAEALHQADLEIWVMVSPGEDFETLDLAALQLTVDRFVAVLHDENSESDPPGPIASLPWLEGWMKVMSEFGEPGQWVGVLGAYAYDWNITKHNAETLSFKDAMSRASYAGVDQGTKAVTVTAPNYNGIYSYSDPNGEHTVCFLDAISFYNQLRTLRSAHLGGIGISRLGAEDPQIWDVLEARHMKSGNLDPGFVKSLNDLHASETITHVGKGEIVNVNDTRDDGKRTVELEPGGNLKARYLEFPTYPILYHQGASNPHEVAITFDDGPDPIWTPKILDILKERGIKACFFLIGRNAEDYPSLVERIVKEGHEIGNHTYSHQNLSLMSPWRMRLELNMTQRVIESVTGRSTTLFRPPYNADSNPSKMSELVPLKFAQDELHYTVVLESIDPQDWARPGADVILQRVKDQRNTGNIVLLHDAGGDRSQTVAALPRIIDYLETRGDKIVPMSDLIDLSRDDVMPPAANNQSTMEGLVAHTGFRIHHAIVEFFWAAMIFATGLVIARTLLVAWLAHRHHRRLQIRKERALTGPPAPTPAVSVIIAAYNEGKVIEKTLRSVVSSDYPGQMEVIVVDDGSKDNTAAEVERFATVDSRVRLIRQENGGKALALRNGVSQAKNGLIVFLDADTMFEKQTIRALVAPFSNPLIGAVSGNARVGNLRSFIARCQALEYICGFNLDRRAYTEWNCITVVPGAVSALRKSAIDAAGGFSHDTLAEDTDLTLTMHRLQYQMEFAPDAIAWTEAPETVWTLAKQRFRWAFGTMQCLWKHRDLIFNPRYGALGFFSLPGIWFFQIGLVAITPLVDVILIWSIFFGHAGVIWYYFLIFLLMEIFLSAVACWMEGEPMRQAWISLPMRVIYRPMLAWVIWRSILRAFKGALVGWGKLERTASVPTRV